MIDTSSMPPPIARYVEATAELWDIQIGYSPIFEEAWEVTKELAMATLGLRMLRFRLDPDLTDDERQEWQARADQERHTTLLAHRAPIAKVAAYRRWKQQLDKSGMSAASARRFADPWIREPEWDVVRTMLGQGFIPMLFQPRCEHDDDPLLHLSDFDGVTYRVVVKGGRAPMLHILACDRQPSFDERRAEEVELRGVIDEDDDRPGLPPEVIQQVHAIMDNAVNRRWNEGKPDPEPPRPRPTAEERKAARIEKLRKEAEKLGMAVVPHGDGGKADNMS